MASVLSLSPPSLLTFSLARKTSFFHQLSKNPSRKYHQTVRTTKFPSFLDLEPKLKKETLQFDLPLFNHTDRIRFDVIVIGAGPAGLRLAQQVSKHGIKVCCLDPSPLSMWPNTYGVWVDEFESLGLEDCLEKTWPVSSIYIDDQKVKHLDRAYAKIDRKGFKLRLLSECAANGVTFHKAKACKVDHGEFESSVTCGDGTVLNASLVVDASGFASRFIEYDKPRNCGYQIAHGILAEVDGHPFDLDKMILMDWRDSHLKNEPSLYAGNLKSPTFLYALPMDSNLIFLEETSVVNRPILSYTELKHRMDARLRHLGIRVRAVIEDEKCWTPMGGSLPKMPQSVMAFGGNSGIVNPATGYMMARAMALAPVLAETIVECLGSSTKVSHGAPLYRRSWDSLWPLERRLEREFFNFGMEVMIKLDLNKMRGFLDAFFKLDPRYLNGFFSSTLSLGEILMLSVSILGHAANPTRFDIATNSSSILVGMVMRNLGLKRYFTVD